MSIVTETVQLKWEKECNIIVGQAHFIKTVEDIPEILISSVPDIKYGLAFCEASGACLIRTEGNNEKLINEATGCAKAVAAGHTFFLIIKNAYPINILNQIKNCQEVVSIFAATANPLQILVAETKQGRGIIGVIDGYSPKGIENTDNKNDRKQLLRSIGYKIN